MFTIQKNKVTFSVGTKPSLIKQAQREVRDTYLLLCQANAPRATIMAKGFLITEVLGNHYPALRAASPTFDASLNSACKAYSICGTNLQHKKMYSMDFYVPAEDLQLLRGISPELLLSLSSAGVAEVCFCARES